MDREYIIAGFRIRLEQVDRLFVRPGSHMARAFEPVRRRSGSGRIPDHAPDSGLHDK